MSRAAAAPHALTALGAVNSFLSTLVILADSARGLHIVDLAAPGGGKSVRSISDAHGKSVHAIAMNAPSAFSPSAGAAGEQILEHAQLFATSAADSCVKLWDVRASSREGCVRRFSGHVNRSAPVRASFSPCGRFLATGSEDNRAYIFDIRSGQILDKLAGATDVVCDVAFNPLHPQIVTAGYDGRIRFYGTA